MDEFSININDYNPHAFCLIRVELDEQGQPEDWTFIYCNDALARLEGVPKEQLLGHRFYEIFPNGSRHWLKPYYKAAYENTPSSYDEISEEIGQYLHVDAFPAGERGVCACVLRDIKEEFEEQALRNAEYAQTVEKLEEERQLNAQVQLYATTMGVVYPLAISMDYLANEYRMLEYEHFINKTANWSGTVDELIAVGASTIPDPDLAAQFSSLFNRENALAAFRSGATELTLQHPQLDDDGKMHWMETKVICLECTEKSAKAISVSKCIDEEKLLERAHEKLTERDLILTALSDDYDEIYFCDIEADTLHVLKSDDMALVGADGKYSAIGQLFFRNRVVVESVPDMLNRLNRKELMAYLEENKAFAIRYQLKPDERGRRFAETKFVHVDSDSGFMVVIGTHYIDDIVNDQKRQEAALADALALEKQHSEVISSLSAIYTTIFWADVRTRDYQVINSVDLMGEIAGTAGMFDDVKENIITAFFSPDTQERMRVFLDFDTLAGRLAKIDTIVEEYKNTDGRWFQGRFIVNKRDENGAVVNVLYVARDFTDEKLHELEQQRQLRTQLQIINALANEYKTLYLVDCETKQWTVCKMAEKGVAKQAYEAVRNYVNCEAAIDAFIDHYVVEEDRQRLRESITVENMLKETPDYGIYSVNYDRYVENGREHWQANSAKFTGEDGKVYLVFGFRNVHDIVENQLRQEDALRNALMLARHASRAKTSFLSNMSHDIRTPMNAIIGFTALAQAHIDNTAQVKDYLAKIHTSSNHLLSLINEILDMSRIESGTVKLDETTVHIPDVLHDLRTMIQGQVAAKQQNLYIDTVDVTNEEVITDKLRLNQILLNITSNAIKYTAAGGDIIIRVKEKPCARREYTTYEFSVKDTGIGMAPEFIEHVFDAFTREQSSTVSGIQGTGLGMSITKNIVDLMDGTIEVKSQQGVGTEFIVTIDFRLADSAIKYEPIPNLQGARVLVVDDDVNTCQSVSKMLREIEMRPDWSTSGKEAVIRAKEATDLKDEYKAYIIDYLMPDMNGIETVRQIRRVISEEVPIIVLTAYDWSDIEDEAIDAGVTAFVAKPIFMSELHSVLANPTESNKTAEIEAPAMEYDFSGKRVLLVEDNELNREIATSILEEIGIQVDGAADGTEAVDIIYKAPEDQYDLILMDIQMPLMDGYTATREIRTLRNNKKANIPIVAMTANAFEEDRQKAFEAGMNGHIPKPIDIATIAKVLDEIFDA